MTCRYPKTVLILVLGMVAWGGCAGMPMNPLAARKSETEDAKLSFGRLCEKHGETEQAKKVYESMVKQNPKSSLPYQRLGVMAAKAGKYSDAEAYFQKAMAIGTPSAELLNDVGYTLYLQDKLAEAEKSFRAALEVDPHFTAAHNNLGLVLGQQGNMEESLASFKKGGTEAQARNNVAYAYFMRGEMKLAQQNYSRALSLDQTNRPAAEALLQVARFTPPTPADLPTMEADGDQADDASSLAGAKSGTKAKTASAKKSGSATVAKSRARHRVPTLAQTKARIEEENSRSKRNKPKADVDRAQASAEMPGHRPPFAWKSEAISGDSDVSVLSLRPQVDQSSKPPKVAKSTRGDKQRSGGDADRMADEDSQDMLADEVDETPVRAASHKPRIIEGGMATERKSSAKRSKVYDSAKDAKLTAKTGVNFAGHDASDADESETMVWVSDTSPSDASEGGSTDSGRAEATDKRAKVEPKVVKPNAIRATPVATTSAKSEAPKLQQPKSPETASADKPAKPARTSQRPRPMQVGGANGWGGAPRGASRKSNTGFARASDKPEPKSAEAADAGFARATDDDSE